MVALQHNAIAAARAAGVTQVVKVSAFAASDHSRAPIGRWHHQVEKELQESDQRQSVRDPRRLAIVGRAGVWTTTGGFLPEAAVRSKLTFCSHLGMKGAPARAIQ